MATANIWCWPRLATRTSSTSTATGTRRRTATSSRRPARVRVRAGRGEDQEPRRAVASATGPRRRLERFVREGAVTRRIVSGVPGGVGTWAGSASAPLLPLGRFAAKLNADSALTGAVQIAWQAMFSSFPLILGLLGLFGLVLRDPGPTPLARRGDGGPVPEPGRRPPRLHRGDPRAERPARRGQPRRPGLERLLAVPDDGAGLQPLLRRARSRLPRAGRDGARR